MTAVLRIHDWLAFLREEVMPKPFSARLDRSTGFHWARGF